MGLAASGKLLIHSLGEMSEWLKEHAGKLIPASSHPTFRLAARDWYTIEWNAPGVTYRGAGSPGRGRERLQLAVRSGNLRRWR
jgi:hypothetical protein